MIDITPDYVAEKRLPPGRSRLSDDDVVVALAADYVRPSGSRQEVVRDGWMVKLELEGAPHLARPGGASPTIRVDRAACLPVRRANGPRTLWMSTGIVETTGVEPATSALQGRRSTN